MRWRKAHEKTQAEAARLFEVSQSALCEYEKGNKLPGVRVALRMARVTDGEVPVPSWGEDLPGIEDGGSDRDTCPDSPSRGSAA